MPPPKAGPNRLKPAATYGWPTASSDSFGLYGSVVALPSAGSPFCGSLSDATRSGDARRSGGRMPADTSVHVAPGRGPARTFGLAATNTVGCFSAGTLNAARRAVLAIDSAGLIS